MSNTTFITSFNFLLGQGVLLQQALRELQLFDHSWHGSCNQHPSIWLGMVRSLHLFLSPIFLPTLGQSWVEGRHLEASVRTSGSKPVRGAQGSFSFKYFSGVPDRVPMLSDHAQRQVVPEGLGDIGQCWQSVNPAHNSEITSRAYTKQIRK